MPDETEQNPAEAEHRLPTFALQPAVPEAEQLPPAWNEEQSPDTAVHQKLWLEQTVPPPVVEQMGPGAVSPPIVPTGITVELSIDSTFEKSTVEARLSAADEAEAR